MTLYNLLSRVVKDPLPGCQMEVIMKKHSLSLDMIQEVFIHCYHLYSGYCLDCCCPLDYCAPGSIFWVNASSAASRSSLCNRFCLIFEEVEDVRDCFEHVLYEGTSLRTKLMM